MNKENFRIIKEINSLIIKIKLLKDQIASEASRIDKIDAQVEQKTVALNQVDEQLIEIRKNIRELEAKLHELNQTHFKASAAVNNSFSEKDILAATKQKESAEAEIEVTEGLILECMEREEELDSQKQAHLKFLDGVKSGRSEIEEDITEENKPRLDQIESYKQRISLNLEQLEPLAKSKTETLMAKNLPKGFVVELDSKNHCQVCGTQVSGNQAREIEEQMKLLACSGCSRIIIPQSSKYL